MIAILNSADNHRPRSQAPAATATKVVGYLDEQLRRGAYLGLSPTVDIEGGYSFCDSFVVTQADLGALAIVEGPSFLGSVVLRFADLQPHRDDARREIELIGLLKDAPTTIWEDRMRLQLAPLQRELSEIRLRARFGGGSPRRW